MTSSAFLLAAGHTGDRQRYNIGTGVRTSDRELHTLVAQAAGARDEPEYAAARIGDLRESAIDPSRAGAELGWAPRFDLGTGIGATVEYFRRRSDDAAHILDDRRAE